MRAHVIENGTVVNTIVVEDLNILPNLVDADLGGKIGDAWDGISFSEPEEGLDTLRAELKRQADLEKSRVRDAGFLVDGVLFDSDLSARIAYAELGSELLEDPTYTTGWKASDGVWVSMNLALYAQIRAAGKTHTQICFGWFALKEAQIDAAQTVAEARLISTRFGE